MSQTETQRAAAMAEIMGLILIAISRAAPDVPAALSLFDHLTQSSRDLLKANWDDLRRPQFSNNIDAGLNSLIGTMRRIHAETK